MKLNKSKLLTNEKLSRRNLLLGGAAASSALILPKPMQAGITGAICVPSGGGYGSAGTGFDDDFDDDFIGEVPMDGPGERSVYLLNPRNGETFNRTYVVDGQYVPEALEAYNWFARDWRDNDPRNMDPGLLDIIWKMTQMLGVTAPWKMTSGYRNPRSNAKVGGAKNSYHMRGRANDLQHSQRGPRAVYGAAMKIAAGGVGRYNSFTHIDTGPHRTWG
jgi:uncharacterized protein YcbK (DUF882 family)